MNKILLSTLLFASIISTSKAQIYTPTGTVQGSSGNNNVGIGTTAPNAKVEIYNSAQAGHLLLSANDNPNAENTRIDIDFTVADQGHTVGRIASYYSTSVNGGSGGLRFFTRNAGSLEENMRINSNGNLGIGTTNALDILHLKSLNPVVRLEKTGILNWRAGNVVGNNYTIYPDSYNNTTFNITSVGDVGIGTTIPDSKLTVNGTIHATEVKVTQTVPADYVFQKYYTGESELKPDYRLLTLPEIEKFTEENHHLPNVPSAKEIKENGLHLGEMSNILLQKIEELTLYSIAQQKIIEKFEKENNIQSKKIDILEKENEAFKTLSERLSRLENQLKK